MLTYLYSLIYLTSSLLFSITLVLRKGGKNGFLALKGETTIEKLHTTANYFIIMYRMNKLYGKLERATRSLIYFTTRSWEVTNITLGLQFNLSLRTPLCYGQFVWSQKCQKSYIPYLYNTDTSVKRTLGSVPLVSVLKRFDSTLKHSLVHFVVDSTYFFSVSTNDVAPPFDM